MIEAQHPKVSVRRQCELLSVSRSGWYAAREREPSVQDVALMKEIDRIYTDCPWYGSRRISVALKRGGRTVNRKRIRRLMRVMDIQGAAPRRNTSRPAPHHPVYPYLLRNLPVTRPDQVWCTDITYVPVGSGYMYLAAVMDWHSRHVLSWELSNTLDSSFCVEALKAALAHGRPEIFNTDQGSQFTSTAFVSVLEAAGVRISMDGRGRALDNVFIERLWRTVKHEDIYLRGYDTVPELYRGLIRYFHYYNHDRPHQGLGYRTPAEVYFAGQDCCPPGGRDTGTATAQGTTGHRDYILAKGSSGP
jgi:putative transposase